MAMRLRARRTILLATASLSVVAMFSTGCMQYAADGSVVTPAPPGDSASSRLPQLLSQLQSSGANIELLDGSQSQVLAAQDQQGKESPDATSTVAGESTQRATSTPVPGTPTRATTPTRTPTPTRTSTQTPEDNTTPSPTPSPTATATPTSTPTPSPVPTSTPIPAPPSEGSPGSGNPPTE